MADEEILADRILRWLGNNPAAYPQLDDKWPVIVADLLFYSLPIIFGLLFLLPLLWLWFGKKKLTLRSVGLALLKGLGLVVLGVIGWFLFLSFGLGQIARELYG